MADCGTILTTDARLPRQSPSRPPDAHILRSVGASRALAASAIIMVRRRSSGAVTVRLTAPARPPARKRASGSDGGTCAV